MLPSQLTALTLTAREQKFAIPAINCTSTRYVKCDSVARVGQVAGKNQRDCWEKAGFG